MYKQFIVCRTNAWRRKRLAVIIDAVPASIRELEGERMSLARQYIQFIKVNFIAAPPTVARHPNSCASLAMQHQWSSCVQLALIDQIDEVGTATKPLMTDSLSSRCAAVKNDICENGALATVRSLRLRIRMQVGLHRETRPCICTSYNDTLTLEHAEGGNRRSYR
jgi:hypothetical protein